MRFAHLADIHLGSWREPQLQQLNMAAFKEAIRICKENDVDFILIAGDLFDNPMPSIDILKEAVSQLKELKDKNIPCYIIPGSHDYSTSGKTFIDVLEKAGLCRNIAQFQENEEHILLEFHTNNNLLITGLPGKKSGLEQRMFESLTLQDSLENHKDKLRIFMLHTTLTEHKPKEMAFVESLDTNKLPAGFDYYAAGHIHNTAKIVQEGRTAVYPGPLFPNSFPELEQLGAGNFFLIDVDENTNPKQLKIKPQQIRLKETLNISINLDKLTPEQATKKIMEEIEKHNIADKILLLRLTGCIEGKVSSINFGSIEDKTKNSYILLKNIHKLTSSELKIELKTKASNVEDIEKEILVQYAQETEHDKFSHHMENLIAALDIEKQEGETNASYEQRVAEETVKILNIKDKL